MQNSECPTGTRTTSVANAELYIFFGGGNSRGDHWSSAISAYKGIKWRNYEAIQAFTYDHKAQAQGNKPLPTGGNILAGAFSRRVKAVPDGAYSKRKILSRDKKPQ